MKSEHPWGKPGKVWVALAGVEGWELHLLSQHYESVFNMVTSLDGQVSIALCGCGCLRG